MNNVFVSFDERSAFFKAFKDMTEVLVSISSTQSMIADSLVELERRTSSLELNLSNTQDNAEQRLVALEDGLSDTKDRIEERLSSLGDSVTGTQSAIDSVNSIVSDLQGTNSPFALKGSVYELQVQEGISTNQIRYVEVIPSAVEGVTSHDFSGKNGNEYTCPAYDGGSDLYPFSASSVSTTFISDALKIRITDP